MMRKQVWAAIGIGIAFVGGIGAGTIGSYVRPESDLSTAPIATPSVSSRSPAEKPSSPSPAVAVSHDWPVPNIPVSDTEMEIWECEVAIVGGSLGGVAAAIHAMRAGAQTCVIELTSWLGGQVSSQAVSAIDESPQMRERQNFSSSWVEFKQAIARQTVPLPAELGFTSPVAVSTINSCWVGDLCFPPLAGHQAVADMLEVARESSPRSRWSVDTAFKGAEFTPSGDRITAVYAVKRIPRDPNYIPLGHFSREMHTWYAWASNDTFEKTPLRLQAPPGKSLTVIDATDTGELVGWANIPHRLGSESQATTGEPNAIADNPDCTQAYTYPFVMAIADDGGKSRSQISKLQTGFSKAEHRNEFDLEGFPMFSGQSVFNYRRIVSQARTNPFVNPPIASDMTSINWNRGNDWGWMDPPLIVSQQDIDKTGQRQNWMGGLHLNSLKEAENHALLFSEWLMEYHAAPGYAMAHLSGKDSPIPTETGLSFYPYIREGRRILGRAAYGDDNFQIREQDLRVDMSGGRDFRATAVGFTHYAIDIHGCRYRNWEPSGSAQSAPINEYHVKPIYLPVESLVPQKIDNLLVGSKGIAVTHIANGATRTHYGEWSIGAAAGTIAAWHVHPERHDLSLGEISTPDVWPQVRERLRDRGLRLEW
ncbi:MAG: FAD-dependent oxidoreductase [Cyanobacteria bacterium J06642_2]